MRGPDRLFRKLEVLRHQPPAPRPPCIFLKTALREPWGPEHPRLKWWAGQKGKGAVTPPIREPKLHSLGPKCLVGKSKVSVDEDKCPIKPEFSVLHVQYLL